MNAERWEQVKEAFQAAQELPAARRKARLISARSWYQQSLHVWLDMRGRGVLRGVQEHAPDQIEADLARCDSAIRDLRKRGVAVSESIHR